jgi:myosin heavy subunit
LQAIYSRDALAKALYEKVFQWLVTKINENIHSNHKEKDLTVIGLLGILELLFEAVHWIW